MLQHDVNSILQFETEACKLLLNNIRESYIFLDTDLRIVYFNKEAKEQARLYYGREIYIGMPIIEMMTTSNTELPSQVYKEAMEGNRFVSENEHRLPDGSTIYFESTFQAAYTEQNEIAGAIISSREITDKKKAQQAIQESEERLQFALEAANQVAWDWNLQTNEVIYSGSYKKLYGFSENELKADFSDWVSRIHPEDRKIMQAIVTTHIDSRNPDHDSRYRIRDAEGRYRWIKAKGRLVSFDADGKPLRMIGTHTDITEEVNREIELKQVNGRFNSMMRATHELLWEWDIENDQMFRTKDGVQNIVKLFGKSPAEKVAPLLQRVHPDDRQNILNILDKILHAPHRHTFELEYRFLDRRGDYAWVYDRAILLRDEWGKPVRVVGSAQNISERKRLERELLRNKLEYQRLLHKAMVESQEAERGEIGKELHDNINQVLTTTKLYLELALSNTELKDDLVSKSLFNISKIIQEIRLLSRSLMDPGIDDLGLTDTIRDLIENIHLTQQIKVELCTDEAIESVLESQQKVTLFRIIQESLSNVLRHSKATSARIELSVEDKMAKLLISDNGVGFLPEATRFGTGLTNIQNRIYLINGTLQLKASPGNGCTIELQFPIVVAG